MNSETPVRVLIAEDDRALADIMRSALVRVGMDVTVVHDGQKALGLARSRPFDFILSDYQMPKMDGEKFLRSVREDSLCSQAHLIFCSAQAYELDSEEMVRDLQLSKVFYKPFSLAELSKALLELKNQPLNANSFSSGSIEKSSPVNVKFS